MLHFSPLSQLIAIFIISIQADTLWRATAQRSVYWGWYLFFFVAGVAFEGAEEADLDVEAGVADEGEFVLVGDLDWGAGELLEEVGLVDADLFLVELFERFLKAEQAANESQHGFESETTSVA